MPLKWLNAVEEAVIALLLVATTLLVFVEVVLRFGFGTGFLWSQELTLHLSAWFVLFGASYGLKMGSHIGVDAFVRVLPRGAQRAVSAFAVVLGLGYCGLFLYGSWVYLEKMHLIGIELEDLPIPAWLAHGVLLAGFAFLSIRLLVLLWQIATDRATGFPRKTEAEQGMRLARELAGKGGERP
jgi:C4-dicarboxylate transporter DctQ subunit